MTSPTMQLLAWAGRQGPDVAQDVAHAIALAQDAHRGQFRYSGDPYIEHPIAVGLILSQVDADPPTVVAGVLHHLATTSMFDPLRVRESFGDTVADLITELQIIDQSPTPPAATDHDRRALLIKIAHRLHNMRTIRFVTPTGQLRKAVHTQELVTPLARSLGLAEIGDELDSLVASTLHAHSQADERYYATQPGVTGSRASIRVLHCALVAAAHVLPLDCRQRWIQEWRGELYAADTLKDRLRYTADVIAGLPTMATITRARSDQ